MNHLAFGDSRVLPVSFWTMLRPEGFIAAIAGLEVEVSEGLVVMRRSADPSDRFVWSRADAKLLGLMVRPLSPKLADVLDAAARLAGDMGFTRRSESIRDIEETYEGIPRPKPTGMGSPWKQQIGQDVKASKRPPMPGGYKKK